MQARVAEFGLEQGSGVDTPGVKDEDVVESPQMSGSEAAKLRRGAAKVNYLSQDIR